jgi:predicted Zn-dependent peptidase
VIFVGYHRPSVNHPDDEALEAIASIMGDGRSSRLYERLVKKEQKALSTGSDATFPGDKYPTLVLFYAVPNKGTTSAISLQLIDSEIDRLKKELVTQEELQKYKTNAKKDFVDKMKINSSMAALLTQYDVVRGNWRSLFSQLNRIDKITPEDIKRVANLYFKSTNRTIGEIVPENNKKAN